MNRLGIVAGRFGFTTICGLILGCVVSMAAAVFEGGSGSAALPGDVNGDGAVNIADLVRARKIAAGELPFESAADVDGDSAVTKVDVWLIQEAVLGRPVPERVDSEAQALHPQNNSITTSRFLRMKHLLLNSAASQSRTMKRFSFGTGALPLASA